MSGRQLTFLEETRDDGGTDIPGPIAWDHASHWIKYDHKKHLVETWCKMGPGYMYRLKTRSRPMSVEEVIHSRLRHYSRETILKAYGVVETPFVMPPVKKLTWWQKLFRRITRGR